MAASRAVVLRWLGALGLLTAIAPVTPAKQPPVTFSSTCVCQNSHGKDRWAAKTDSSAVPKNNQEIQAVTPSEIYAWLGPKNPLTRSSPRIPQENKWYALTGRVIDLKVEADGDIHIALQDATGNRPGVVGVEVPTSRQWCAIRKRVFDWTTAKFPFRVISSKTLKMNGLHVVTIIGKAFFDVDHAPKDHSNRRNNQPGYAAWEVHPVMQIVER